MTKGSRGAQYRTIPAPKAVPQAILWFAIPLALVTVLGISTRARLMVSVERAQATGHGAQPAGASLAGGSEYPATVELLPDLVVTKDGRRTIQYHGEVTVSRGLSVGLAWEAEVVDDRGKVVHANITSGASRQNAGDSLSTAKIAPQLDDGYYALRVRVAVAIENEPSDLIEACQYLQVSNGVWNEITDSDWRALSRAGIALSEKEISKTAVVLEGASL